MIHLKDLLKWAKQAEEDDNAEEASGFHRMIERRYAKMGEAAKSKIHANKAAVYEDEEESPMRFISHE